MILYSTITVALLLVTFLMQPQGPTLLMSNKDANEASSSNLQSLMEVDRICFSILYRFDMFLLIILVPWTIWNWKLAFSGITSVEYAQRLFKIDKEDLMPFGYEPDTSDDGESKKESSTHGQYIENVMQQHHD